MQNACMLLVERMWKPVLAEGAIISGTTEMIKR